MPETRPFRTWDVFTETRFAGNPLAVVHEADGLETVQMQAIAREFNLSETIFVQSPEDPAHSARVRIFFPNDEIPFAGHPTLGCAIDLALRTAPAGDFETEISLEEQAGLVPVQVARVAGRISATLTAPVLPHAPVGGTRPDDALLAQAVGLADAQIGFAGQRAGVWQGGPGYVYIPVADTDALAAARPREPAWSRAMEMAGADGAYLYTPGADCAYRARMFAPVGGVPEDPATGSAAAILAAQLLACGALGEGETRLALRQGVEMGRPSELGLTALVANGLLTEARVTGSAVAVGEGRIAVPET